MKFPVHSVESAPDRSKPFLNGALQKYGFVPNLLATMADEPVALEAYMALGGFFEKSSLSPVERQLVLLAVSQANACQYCLAAHSVMAKMNGVPPEQIAAVRIGDSTGDDRLDGLLAYVREATTTRGYPSAETVSRFASAGYSSTQALAVLLGITMKTLSNYVNHVAATQIDSQFTSA